MSMSSCSSFSPRTELYNTKFTFASLKLIIKETSILSPEALGTKLVKVRTFQQLGTSYPLGGIEHEDLLEDIKQLFVLAIKYLNEERSTLAIDSLHILGKMNLLLFLYSMDFKSS